MNCSMCIVGKGLGVIAIAGVASLGGYNLATTGCVSGLGPGSADFAVSTQVGDGAMTGAAMVSPTALIDTGAGMVEPHECVLDEAGACEQCVLEAEAEAQALEEAAKTITETVPADG